MPSEWQFRAVSRVPVLCRRRHRRRRRVVVALIIHTDGIFLILIGRRKQNNVLLLEENLNIPTDANYTAKQSASRWLKTIRKTYT